MARPGQGEAEPAIAGANTGQRAEFQPLYAQVEELLLQRIATGGWQPGEMLPNEFQLAAEYRVSQGTVRKALIALEAKRLIVRQQGKGTHVAQHTPQRSLYHFFRIVGLNDARLTPLSEVLSQHTAKATRAQAEQLGVPTRSALHAIKRVRSFEGRTTIFERIFVPVELMPQLSVPNGIQLNQEMYVIYQQRWGVTIVRATERLAAVRAIAEEARALEVAVGSPLIEITRLARDVTGRTVELRISRVETTRHRYAVEVY